MSQQEFEPRQQQSDEEIFQPHYPYTWSGQAEQGMPRDEPLGSYRAQTEDDNSYNNVGYNNTPNAAQVPSWARAQRSNNNALGSVALIVLLFIIVFAIGGVGFVGLVLSGLLHILGALLGIIFGFFIFVLILILLILAAIRRGLDSVFGSSRRSARQAWRDERRMARRTARRSWRGW